MGNYVGIGSDDLIIEPIDDKFIYITREEHFSDIKSFELGFDNGKSIFIPADKVIDYFFQVVNLVDAVEDKIFNKALEFRRGCLKIDASFLSDMLGDNYFDAFIKKAELNNIKVEYNNDYPIHSNIPFMLLLPSDSDTGIVRSYSEEDGTFIIYWNYEKLM